MPHVMEKVELVYKNVFWLYKLAVHWTWLEERLNNTQFQTFNYVGTLSALQDGWKDLQKVDFEQQSEGS